MVLVTTSSACSDIDFIFGYFNRNRFYQYYSSTLIFEYASCIRIGRWWNTERNFPFLWLYIARLATYINCKVSKYEGHHRWRSPSRKPWWCRPAFSALPSFLMGVTNEEKRSSYLVTSLVVLEITTKATISCKLWSSISMGINTRKMKAK